MIVCEECVEGQLPCWLLVFPCVLPLGIGSMSSAAHSGPLLPLPLMSAQPRELRGAATVILQAQPDWMPAWVSSPFIGRAGSSLINPVFPCFRLGSPSSLPLVFLCASPTLHSDTGILPCAQREGCPAEEGRVTAVE